jgi:hypothetical protein
MDSMPGLLVSKNPIEFIFSGAKVEAAYKQSKEKEGHRTY